MAACLTLSLRSTWPAWPRAGTIPGRGGGWMGRPLQANLVRLNEGDRIQPHRNDEVNVLVVVVSIGDLGVGEDVWISLVIRDDQLVPVGGATSLRAGG
jgi:hypothetical protein